MDSAAEIAAQLSMAKSAEQMLILTAAQLVIAVVGTIGLFVTINYTRRSLGMTREALSLQSMTSRQQLRAYLGITSINLGQVGVGQRPLAKLSIKNFGSTPANDIRVHISVRVGSEVDRNAPGVDLPSHLLAPGAEMASYGKCETELTEEDLTALEAGGRGRSAKVVLVGGTIRFRDVFDDDRRLDFGVRFWTEGGKLQRRLVDWEYAGGLNAT